MRLASWQQCSLRPQTYDGCMSLTGEYEPSPRKWVREQVERYEATDGREANTLPGSRRPIVIFTTRGRKSGKIRKFALMRVEHDASTPWSARRAVRRSIRSGTTTSNPILRH
jgi:hypothetical protein